MEAVDILIAESDEVEARLIREALAPVLNRIQVFTDAEEAADYLLKRGEYQGERRTPDLMILDVELIGDGCWDLIAKLRDQAEYTGSMIVVVDGEGRGDGYRARQARKAADAGAHWFVGKPVKLETLARIVEDLEDMGLAVVRGKVVPER